MKNFGFAALLVAIAGLFVGRNLPWHLDDFDQAKQAYTSWEMVHAGHWLYQHTPQEKIATKPPLAGWISAALYEVTGWWDGAWRLPSLLSAIALLVLMVRAGRELWPANGALVAVAALGLNGFAPRLATLARTDMLLTLLISGAGILIWRKVRDAEPWTFAERWLLGGCVLGSMLTKGPILYAFLLPGLVLFWVVTRRSVAWSGWGPWVWPLLVFGAWAVYAIWKVDGFYDQVVVREFAGRFEVGEEAVHKNQPVYFYLGHLFGKWAPWSVALLALLAWKPARAQLRARPDLMWLLCWAGGALVVMSLIPSKRPDRIFPVIPPLGLLLVGLAAEVKWRRLGLVVWVVIVGALLGSGGYAVAKVESAWGRGQGELPAFGQAVLQRFAAGQIAVVRGDQEGMLLYLGQLHFADREAALRDLRGGKLAAVVMSDGDWETAAGEGEFAVLMRSHEQLAAGERERLGRDSRYVVLVRK